MRRMIFSIGWAFIFLLGTIIVASVFVRIAGDDYRESSLVSKIFVGAYFASPVLGFVLGLFGILPGTKMGSKI